MLQICPKVVLILLALILIYSLGPWLQDELLAAGEGTALHHLVLIKALKFGRKEQRCPFPHFCSHSQVIIKGPVSATNSLFCLAKLETQSYLTLWGKKVPQKPEDAFDHSLIHLSIHEFIFFSFLPLSSFNRSLYTSPYPGAIDFTKLIIYDPCPPQSSHHNERWK